MFTANNFTGRGRFLPLLFFIFCLATAVELKAQKISKYYTVIQQESGSLYFIEPEYGFENKKENAGLNFDMTFLTSEDSIKVNFSFVFPEIIQIDSISFVLMHKNISSATEKLFIEDEKKVWKHRYSSQFMFEDIDEIFLSDQSPELAVYFSGQMILLTMKQNRWKKEREILNRILKLIKVN